MKGASARFARRATDMPPSASNYAAGDQTARVGILAGGGGIPIEIARTATASGHEVHIVAIDPGVDERIAEFPHHRVGLGQVGRILQVLRAERCRDLIIAGSLRRPDLFALRIDWGFVRHLPRILRLMRGGDDSVLRRVIGFFESQGFHVRGIADIAPELMAREGTMTRQQPTPAQHADLTQGCAVLQELGRFDIGQGVVVRNGAVLAVEAAEGTDAMLHRISSLTGSGGVLVKLAKPGQELRIDLLTIGPRTVAGARQAGLEMIAVEAGHSVLADRAQTFSSAEDYGIAIYGVARPGDRKHPTRHAATSVLTGVGRTAMPERSRRDAALARDIMLALGQHGEAANVIVNREFVLAVGLGDDPLALIDRALTCLPWGMRRRRRLPGVVALGDATRVTSRLIDAVARARLSGVLVNARDDTDIAHEAVAAADRHGLFIAGVTT